MSSVRGPIRWPWIASIAAACVFLTLASGLPPETFFVGDPGVKLIAARHALSDRPLEIPLPTIGAERVPYVEPFFAVHGDHSHAVTSAVFPLLSSPFIALFGVRGAYMLPALGFFLYLAACAQLARALGSRSASVAVATAALGTPLLFYGLEFWEHAPAVGLATLATVWLIDDATENLTRAFTAGLLYGLAILLRPEALLLGVAVVVASRLLAAPPKGRVLIAALVGVLFSILPLSAYAMIHFGTAVPPHIGSHTALLTEHWFTTRVTLVARWFVPGALATADLWGLALLALVALGWYGVKSRGNGSAFLASVALIDIVLVVLTAPNDGGGQWGPRYLLFAFAPAAVLAAGAFEAAARRHPVGIVVVVLALGVGGWAQRDGYRDLRGTKLTYGRVLDFVRLQIPKRGYAVTDLWWLDQVVAAALDERQMLFAPTPAEAHDVSRRLASAGIDEMTVIRSRNESADTDDWLVDACFEETARRTIPERSLVSIQYRRACSP
jgi:hypothetical protein